VVRLARCSNGFSVAAPTWQKKKGEQKGHASTLFNKKIRLAEIQLQSDPKNESVRSILSEAQGHMADSLQDQVARNHQLTAAS
jgi:hypothetical protein